MTNTTKFKPMFTVKTKAQARHYLKLNGLTSITLPGRKQVIEFTLRHYTVRITNLKGKFIVSKVWTTASNLTAQAA